MIRAMSRAALALLFVATTAVAKVSPQEAARLLPAGDLTPQGAEKAGNAAGTIPAWTGGLTTSPPCYKGIGTRVCDPFPDDKPLFEIGAANVDKYKANLSDGQIAMLKKYPNSYKMRVYPTRRTLSVPDFVNKATYENATRSELAEGGDAVVNAVTGTPFAIPKTGHEPIWNHKLRYRGVGAARWNAQAAVTTTGDFNLVKLKEDVKFHYGDKGIKPEDLKNVAIYFLQVVTEPPRLAGTITLVHETMDQVKEPRRAWQYNPGQRRLRRAPNVGYDNPGTGSDGLRTNDQFDGLNGALDRYNWKMVGKKEIYVPYNSYQLHSDKYKYKDILKVGHMRQDIPRYELHRVWVVDSEVKPTTTHIYKRRVFYIDEDSWTIVLVDCYDRRDQLWRWQELHSVEAYDQQIMSAVAESIYDLQSGRYIVLSMNNEEPETVQRNFDVEYFNPANVSKQTTK
ncbi:MAG: DUF1329 domain-containing protein [Gammaproteobacteria bacterium]|nr:DUF1329 domain-containing protein [Gammaproteobacteria bacterium]